MILFFKSQVRGYTRADGTYVAPHQDSRVSHPDNAMEHFHGSHEPIAEIHNSGAFGGIFGASSVQSARSHGDVVHRIVSPRPLTNFELNHSIEGAWDEALKVARGDEAIAESIMSADCPNLADCEPEDLAEQGWEFQRLRGVLAQRLGYTSVEMRDEHGTTWLCLPGCKVEMHKG